MLLLQSPSTRTGFQPFPLVFIHKKKSHANQLQLGKRASNACLLIKSKAEILRAGRLNGRHGSRTLVSNATSDAEDNVPRVGLQEALQSLIPEVAALGFPRDEIRAYLMKVKTAPKAFGDLDMQRTVPVFDELLKGKDAEGIEDVQALEALKVSLTKLYGWKRRGRDLLASDRPIHIAALEDLHGCSPDESEKISSMLLDDLPITEEQKADLSSVVQTVAVAGIQSIVWNGIGLAVIFLIAFNFLLLN